MSFPILSFVTFLPLLGAILLMFIPKDKKGALYTIALAVAFITFAVSLLLYFHFDAKTADPQFVEKGAWLGYGINYHLGIDGISLFLVLLTTFLMPIALLSSWS